MKQKLSGPLTAAQVHPKTKATPGRRRSIFRSRLPHINVSPFSLGRYYLFNIVIYLSLSLATIRLINRFQEISWWWVASLLPLFLPRFGYIVVASLALAIITLWQLGVGNPLLYVLVLPVCLCLGHWSTVFIHNAVHYNFKPRWLNRFAGEICALQQLSAGFPVLRMIHIAHHGHPDDKERDPHPPQGYSFLEFVDISQTLVRRWLAETYFRKWGKSQQTKRLWITQNLLLVGSRFSKAFFLFVLLGPQLFALLYLPSYLSSVYLFAAVNYFSHRARPDGSVEVLNLESNAYYRFCNKVFFGIMYHKNHHLRPRAFNPMRTESRSGR